MINLIILFSLSLISLLIFSYTQIDLNLTLSSWPLYQGLQNSLIQLGYFNRPLNSLFYLVVCLLLIVVYVVVLIKVKRNQLSGKQLAWFVAAVGLVGLLAYPAFSHDIFNYIFDAKILGFYGQNPYQLTALDFPEDLWTRFMHWTHRRYPYGPVWLIITLPFLWLGLGKFSLTLLSFKFLNLLAYGLSCWLMVKISQQIKLKRPELTLALLAFNPLVIVEGLVAGHLDLIMLALVLGGLHFYLKNRRVLSGGLYLLAAGVKFIPLVFLPSLFLKLKQTRLITLLVLGALAPLLIYSIKHGPQPWYWLLPLGLSLLLPAKSFWRRLLLSLSLLQPLTYAPFFYLGDYGLSKLVISWLVWIVSLILAFLLKPLLLKLN